MGFFSAFKKLWSGKSDNGNEAVEPSAVQSPEEKESSGGPSESLSGENESEDAEHPDNVDETDLKPLVADLSTLIEVENAALKQNLNNMPEEMESDSSASADTISGPDALSKPECFPEPDFPGHLETASAQAEAGQKADEDDVIDLMLFAENEEKPETATEESDSDRIIPEITDAVQQEEKKLEESVTAASASVEASLPDEEDIAETEALLHQETETIAEPEAETPEERIPVSSEFQETESSLSAVEEDIVDLTELAEPAPELQAVHDASWTRPKPSAHDWKAEILPQLRNAEPKLSVWLGICLEGLGENAVAGEALWERIRFLLVSLGAPADESDRFVEDFARWAERMEYEALADFRSELQYRLAIALDLEDEEDERSRLFLKLQEGLSRTREHLGRSLTALFAGHDSLSESFWEELEEVFIMGDMGVETSMELVKRLKARAGKAHMASPEDLRPALAEELREIFRASRKVVAVNPPEVVLVIGVNGVGKTTTIAKLAYRARMQGKKVLLAAADTFRAAAVEQLRIWADRTGSGFHSKGQDADPAAVAWEAMDIAVKEGYDVVFVDTAGRLHTKDNLMAELSKIRNVLGRKCPGAPHRSVLVVDATTGQNALQQTKIFKEAAGVDEIILTKLDGTAKGGIAVAIALRFGLTISFVGLGEKIEDLRPFDGDDFSRALLGLDA